MNKIIIVSILTLLAYQVSYAGPWPKKLGTGYFKLSQWWLVFDEHYTDTGLKDPNVTTGIFNTSIYGEYGFTDRITGILYAPVFSRNYMNNVLSETTGELLIEGEGVNSVGDIDVGIQYGISRPGSPIAVSATLMLGIPSGKTAAGSLKNLQTGDGEFNQFLKIDAGRSLPINEQIDSYAAVYAGVNHRTEGFSEEFRYGLEYGVGFLSRKLWVIGRLNGIESFKNGDTAETAATTSIFANNTEFTGASIEAAYYVTPELGFTASVGAPFRGEIIAVGNSYSVGVFLDLQ